MKNEPKLSRRFALAAIWSLVITNVEAQNKGTVKTLPNFVFKPCTGGAGEVHVLLGDPCSGFSAVTFIHDGEKLRFTARELFDALKHE